MEIPDKSALNGLRDQGVVDAKCILLRRDGEEKGTRHIILTFDNTKLPDSVKAGYLNCKVRPYIPNSRRCGTNDFGIRQGRAEETQHVPVVH